MPKGEEQKIRSRLRSYERKLQNEKQEHGFYRDGAGRRYLIGPHYTIDDIATDAGTIGYEMATGLGARYHRVYTGGE